MRIYKIEAIVSGNNDKPETRVERLIAGGWQDVHELLARICSGIGCAIKEMRIIETNDNPFESIRPQHGKASFYEN
jgi:hypothetical protein